MAPAPAMLSDPLVPSRTDPSPKPNLSGALNRLVFFTLLALFPLSAIRYGTIEPWWQATLVSVLYTLAALSAVEPSLSGGWRMKGFAMLSPLLAITAFAFIQSLAMWPANGATSQTSSRTISADPYATQQWALWMLGLIIAAELLIRYVNGRRRLWILIHTLIGIGVLTGLFGIARQIAQAAGYGGQSGFLLTALGPNIGYGQFVNQNHFALMMEMILGLLLGLLVGGAVRRLQIPVYLSLAGIIWIALVLTESRGGIFAMLSEVLFVALVFTFYRARQTRSDEKEVRPGLGKKVFLIATRAMLAAGLVLAIVVGVAWVGGDPLASRFEQLPKQLEARNDNYEKGRRIDIWQATWGLIRANPIAGVGFGGYVIAIPKYHVASGITSPQKAHNEYLELLANGGVIALVIFLWFVAAIVRRARRRFKSNDQFGKAACLGALAGLCAVAVHSVVDFGLHIPINAMICVALIVIATTNLTRDDLPPIATRR